MGRDIGVVRVRIDRPEEDPDSTDATSRPPRPAADARREGSVDESPAEPGIETDTAERVARVLEHRATVDAVYRAYAIDQGYERIREVEEKTVTPAMLRIEAEDPGRHLAGLEHRLKGKDRLTEKVTKAMDEQPGLTCPNAFALVKDAIRYTFQYTDDRYASGVRADISRLMDAGFERVDLRNTWESENYKGINSRWRVPGERQIFEVQFHTTGSFEAKQETHPAYERLRHPATPRDEQDRLAEYQRKVNARVPTPPGATDIPDYP